MPKKKKTASLDLVSELVNMIKSIDARKKDQLTPQDIKKRLNLTLLEKVYRVFLRKGNEKTFLKVMEIPATRWEKIGTLIRHFKNLENPSFLDERGHESSLQYFIKDLGSFADFKITKVAKADQAYVYISFINPPLDCLMGDLFFFYARGDTPIQELQRFINIIESMPQEYLRKVAFILAPYKEENFRKLVEESPHKFVILSSSSIKDIVLANSPGIELNSTITSHLDLLDIQPYRTHGSTPSTMFFGRKRELDWMLNTPTMSVAIYGGRQLGKTSLLRKLQEIQNQETDKKTVFVTCEGIQNNLALGIEILKQLQLEPKKIKTIYEFEEFFRDYLRKQKGHFTIIIDEVDDLVDLDRKSPQKIFVVLRNINNDFQGKCRFFFAGFKKLYSEFYRLYAPFRNFAEPYELKSLTKKDVKKLIEEPLCNRMGIKFQGRKKIVEKIYEYTAGHPCFIQHYCKCLIERISLDNRRFLTKDDVEAVYQSEAYRNLIIGNYSDNFREGEEHGDVIPKLLICHITFEEMDSFTENGLLTSLKKSQIQMEPFRLRTELRKLTMTSVLERSGNVYSFTNSIYPRILKESENLADILIQLMEEYESMTGEETKIQPLPNPLDHFILRRNILDQIVADTEKNYAIVGGTGFGKTSLLKTLEDFYELDISSKPLLCTGKNIQSVSALLEKILHLVELGGSSPEENLDILKEFIADENQQGRKQVLFIDDVDEVIEQDSKGFRLLLKEFDRLSSEFGEGFRVILSGGSALHSMVTSNPFPKSIDAIHLKPLDERDAHQLLLHFFKLKGNLRFEDETLVDLVLEATGGNPTLLEKFTDLLAEGLEKPLIEEEHLEEVIEKKEFQNFLLQVYEDSWTSFQKKIVKNIVELGQDRFTVSKIVKQSGFEAKALKEEFSKLNLLGFFRRTGRYYGFSNSYYKECFRCKKKSS